MILPPHTCFLCQQPAVLIKILKGTTLSFMALGSFKTTCILKVLFVIIFTDKDLEVVKIPKKMEQKCAFSEGNLEV